MPVYTCTAPAGVLDREERSRLAEEITRIHCERTGAPASFVHVHFTDLADGDTFTAGRPSVCAQVVGTIRAGRSQEDKTAMLEELNQAWIEVTGMAQENILVALGEIPASSAMEGGAVMPEPGEEHERLEAVRGRLTRRTRRRRRDARRCAR